MCERGNYVILLVPIPGYLSGTGEFRWAYKEVDSCIAPIVRALNDAGIYTSGCCCGHGEMRGSIGLHDGRFLIITDPNPSMELLHGLTKKDGNILLHDGRSLIIKKDNNG